MGYNEEMENRFGYLKNLSQEEFLEELADIKDDIERYHEARENRVTGEELDTLEQDFNYAMSKIRYMSNNGLLPEDKPNKTL